MADNNYIEYLERKAKKISQETQDKIFNKFSRQAHYLGNGVYSWFGFYSTDTRELFLMGLLSHEQIKFRKPDEEIKKIAV